MFGHTHDKCIHKKQLYKTNKNGAKNIWVPKKLIIPIVDLLYGKRLETKLVSRQWCSQHVRGTKSTFLNLKKYEGEKVTFGGVRKGKINRYWVGKTILFSLYSKCLI